MISAYVIGLPGSGKSTLLRHLTDDLDVQWLSRPFAHALYWRGAEMIGTQLGGHHHDFPGTDRLSMSVQPKAIAAVRATPWPVCIGEGDRLATGSFLDALAGASEHFDLVWLDVPDELAESRRAHRGASSPTPSWLQGRATKVRRLVETRPHVRLDGTLDPALLVADAISQVRAFSSLAGPDSVR